MKNKKLTLTKEKIMYYALMHAGIIILAAGIYFFKFPNNFTIGGVSGLTVLLTNLPIPISSASIMFIINMLFLVLGFIVLGKEIGGKTVYCSIIFSVILQLFEILYPMSAPFTNQKMLELAFAVILPGIGTAILFTLGASSGGTDIFALIIRKFSNSDLGSALLYSDFVITLSSLFFFGVETCMFSVLGLILKSFVIDNVIENISTKKIVIVITSHKDEVVGYITDDLKRGVTLWKCVGGFTGKEKTAVLAVVTRYQARNLRIFVKKIDAQAFIIINNSTEIIGKGFFRTN